MVLELPAIRTLLSTKSLRTILESKDLAHLGDFLANFIYTCVKIGKFEQSGSVHVWDYSLRIAMEEAQLRSKLGKKTKPDRVADAAEAYIAYAYFTELMSLDDMVDCLTEQLEIGEFRSPKREKEACAAAFSILLKTINELAQSRYALH